MKQLKFWDKAAIQLAGSLATWKFIGIQMAVIGIWYVVNPYQDPLRARLDLAISIWTLLLDNVIILASWMAGQRSQWQLENLERIAGNQVKFLTTLKAVNDALSIKMDTLQTTLQTTLDKASGDTHVNTK